MATSEDTPPQNNVEMAKKLLVEVLRYAVIIFCTMFWSILTIGGVLYERYRKGPSFFEKKEHRRPAILDDGWTHNYIQLSSVKLHYVEAGDEHAPLMVLVHGFPEFWFSWRFQIKHFQRTHRVIAVDQRGYGQSDRPSSVSDYDTRLLAADIEELVKKLGYDSAVMVGHDWGSVVSWRVALTYPQIVKKLVILNAPHPGAFAKLINSNFRQFLNSWYIFMFQLPYLAEFVISVDDFAMIGKMFRGKKGGLKKHPENLTDEDLEAWKYLFSQQGALTGPVNYYRAALRHPIKSTMRDIVQPETLIIWGTADAFLVKEGAELSAQACAQGRVSYIEGASHWVQQDCPEEVNTLIEQFVA